MAPLITDLADPRHRQGAVVLRSGWRAAIADEELRRGYPDADFDDDGWEPVAVPSHWRTVPAFADTDGPVLYRTHFDTPPPTERAGVGDRSWIVFDGVFYTSDVWLDGTYVGDTEGYFFPHVFEITDALAARTEHTLAVEVACRPDLDRTAKRNLTGVFQHWDMHDPGWNPGGLWRPVRVEQSGPVRIKHLRVLCSDADEDHAVVFVRAVLDAADAGEVEIVTTLTPEASVAVGEGVEIRERHLVAAGENQVEWTVPVDRPRRWWPHALGAQDMYTAHVAVHLPETAGDGPSDEQTRRVGLRTVTVDDWIFSVNGERLFLKGSNQGPLTLDLAAATADDFARDVASAKAANLDFLRVHAHVSRPELYDAADEAGLLLWQDMPLQWGYHRSVRQVARNQARELVDLLGHHPSIFLWCGHNEPMTLDMDPDKIDDKRAQTRLMLTGVRQQLLPTWNKTVLDHGIKKVLRSTDGTRPVVAHSGIFPHPPQFDGTDTHVYFGWYHNTERDFAKVMRSWPRLARFVSEFGAQAVPEDSSFLEPERWPDLDWERAYRQFSLQRQIMDRFVPVADHATFESWKEATQDYQCQVIRHHIETLRRLKYRPSGGFAQFHFADCQPSVTWSVLGHDRQAKKGYEALKAACAPVLIMTDRLPETVRPGDALTLDVHVVNDTRAALPDMRASAYLSWGAGRDGGLDRSSGSTPTQHRWRWEGDVPADACIRIGSLQAVVPDAAGPLVLTVELAPRRDPDELVARNQDQVRIVS